MRYFLLPALFMGAFTGLAQTSAPVLLSAGNVNPFPLSVAQGQVLTLFVQSGVTLAPVTASAVSAVYATGGTDQPMPVLQVGQASTGCTALVMAPCPQVLAVTVQVPFGIPVICPPCASPFSRLGRDFDLRQRSGDCQRCRPAVGGPGAFSDLVRCHRGRPRFVVAVIGGLPCTPMITHADGTVVSNIRPAHAGEELAAYVTGLGETIPALITGQRAAQSSPTRTTFGADFNYRANALATQPGAVGAPTAIPLFAGAAEGYIGLYQINFIVPTPPPGIQACVDNAAIPPLDNALQSNLTVSVGSAFSFDGAGICVTPASGS